MNIKQLLASSALLVSALVASSNAFAHNSYYLPAPGSTPAALPATGAPSGQQGTPAGYGWTGGVNADINALQGIISNAPNNLGYEGVHSATNDRYIATGIYAPAATATAAALANGTSTTWGGIATIANNNTLLGQTYSYNTNTANNPGYIASTPVDPLNPTAWGQNPMSTSNALTVTAGAWNNGVSASNTGLSSGSPHFSSGTGNPELNLLNAGVLAGTNATKYVNITVGDDPLFAGTNQLAFSIYQGWAETSDFLNTHNPLYTGLASIAGEDIGVTVQLTGAWDSAFQTAANAGEYTLVFGDRSTGLANFDGHFRYALDISSTATYSVVNAVPVPGAVWLFGSAMAGLIGFGKRKRAA